MLKTPLITLLLALPCLTLGPLSARAAEPGLFVEGKYEKGELKYVDGLPLLLLEGSPREIGRQHGALTRELARKLVDYPKDLLSVIGQQDQYPRLIERSKSLVGQIPKDYLVEIDGFAETSGFDRELLVGVNTMVDTYRGGFGCSSLIVDADRSATGSPLLGRNLDFFTLGKLQRYSLVAIYRPDGKHAFVLVSFPGLIGCLSGMNDAGLAVAVHEVFFSRDGAGMFDPNGTPYTFCFRRILEECTTVEEAEKLLNSMKRTTLLNLSVCDRRSGGVLEITPKNVVLRRSTDGICACTNHFRSDTLGTFALAWRYRILMAAKNLDSIGLAEVSTKLHQVNLGRMTMQTMIFEPGPLRLHLAIGACPTSALPLKRLDLAGLFNGEKQL